MKYKYLMLLALLASCFFFNACATILTVTVPPVEEVTLGEKSVGSQISINYLFLDGAKTGKLLSQPYCFELAEKNILSKKRIHGIVPAIVGIPMYGLGLLDLICAGVYSKASEEESKGNFVETGAIIECGKLKPAVNTKLTVQCSETGKISHATTDSEGNIEINKLFECFHKNTQINLFVKEDGGFAYVTTLENNY